MGDPLISVVIPTFNRGHCVGQAIDSVLAQTYSNLEVLVVDDGSSDDTAELIRTRYAAEARVHYRRKANGGVGSARNEGMSLASGEFIAFLDSDDQWKPWKLATQLQCARRFPELGLLWTDMDAIRPDGSVLKTKYISDFYGCYKRLTLREIFSASMPLAEIVTEPREQVAGEWFYWGDVFSAMFRGNLVHTSTVLLHRAVAAKIRGGFDAAFGQWGEDYDFFLRCTSETQVGFLTISTIRYQVGMPDRATQSKFSSRCAKNCQVTVSRILASPRAKRDLSNATIKDRRAHVHSWAGTALLESGDYVGARSEFLKSLRYRLWQPSNWKLYAWLCMPAGLSRRFHRLYRILKGAMQPPRLGEGGT